MILYTRLLDKGHCLPSRRYLVFDFSTKFLSAPRGDTLCWISRWRSFPLFEAILCARLLSKGIFHPSRRYFGRNSWYRFSSPTKAIFGASYLVLFGLKDSPNKLNFHLWDLVSTPIWIVSNKLRLRGTTHISPKGWIIGLTWGLSRSPIWEDKTSHLRDLMSHQSSYTLLCLKNLG